MNHLAFSMKAWWFGWLLLFFVIFFFHINVSMYIAQIVRELIAGPGGIKNPSLKESEA